MTYRDSAAPETVEVTRPMLRDYRYWTLMAVGCACMCLSVWIGYSRGRRYTPEPPEPCLSWVEVISRNDHGKSCRGHIETTIYGMQDSVLVKCDCASDETP